MPRPALASLSSACACKPTSSNRSSVLLSSSNLQFVLGYTGEEFAASVDHIAEGRIDVTPLITGHVGLGGVKGAFAELASPEQHAKVMVEPWS